MKIETTERISITLNAKSIIILTILVAYFTIIIKVVSKFMGLFL